MATHIFTSIIANYLPKARVLARSVKKLHKDCVFHLILSDAVPKEIKLANEPFDKIWTIEDLGIPSADQWVFKHSIVEASTAVKGFATLRLLDQPGCTEVLYFDPDIVVLSKLDGLLKRFEGASVLLTPHQTEPEETLEAILDNEVCSLKHGTYNLGFVGVKNSREGRRFAEWWAHRLHHFCYDDIPSGLFTDQKWIDLAPGMFPDLAILHEPVYNVSTWNLTNRMVAGSLQSGPKIDGKPVVFYHFSGFDSGAQEVMLNKYGADMPVLYELREWYVEECEKMGQTELSKIPWKYRAFDNGSPVTPAHRKTYRTRADLQEAFPNPFSTSDPGDSYFHWFEASDESRKPARMWRF